MNLLAFLRFLTKGDRSNMDVPASEQCIFLEKQSDPKDDVHRSFLQYKCQMFFVPKWKVCFLNIVATLIYFPVMLFLILRSLHVKREQHYDAVSNLRGMEENIPEELTRQYEILYFGLNSDGELSGRSIWYCLAVFMKFFPSSYFSLKTMTLVAQYCNLIKKHTPKVIITHSEFSFASSLLTDYCHKYGIRQINVMHGEKIYNIRDSFFHFDECYVWNEYYIRLFDSLKAEKMQFKVSVPPALKIDLSKNFNKDCYADYKYYLAVFDEEKIKTLTNSLAFAKRQGKTVKYRLHPRYMDTNIIEKYVTPDDIEDPRQVSILESIASCNYVVGCYSTVLAQAYLSHRNVILDDVVYAETFRKLKEYRYWLIEKELPRLSEFQNGG